jgi:formylglycine-generating enzyme required for sulfatase activity
MTKVFISYSHDSPEHLDRVLDLSDRLREGGVDCHLDQYEMAPPEGWPQWMTKQIEEADFVLVVCTETYQRRFSGKEGTGKGLGVKWEGAVLTQKLYEAGGQNTKLIPVLFSSDDVDHIPDELRRTTRYDLSAERGYEDLYRRLTNQPRVKKPVLGPIQPMPVRERKKEDTAGSGVQQEPVKPGTDAPRSKGSLNVQIEFVRIPAEEFMMGSENGNSNERPVHQVRISRDFEMGKYQVTQAQWEAVMGNNPSNFKGADRPVETVSWDDAQEFIKKLNEKDSSYDYRLPTEAEWEYAARAGSTGDYAGDLDAMAWYGDNSGSKTHPVGQKQPNAWGLYDMHGNVWEWVQDEWHSDYKGAPTDGSAWEDSSGSDRVSRGGSWGITGQYCRSAIRDGPPPDDRHRFLGFRLVRTAR